MDTPSIAPAMPSSPSSPRLHVALVTETWPPEVNGVAMTLARLVDGLLHRGHRVQLIRPYRYRNEPSVVQENFAEVPMPCLSIPNYGELKFGLPSTARLLELWQRQRPDIVHVATEGPLGGSAVNAARQLGLPLTSSFHTNFHGYSRHYGFGWLKVPIAAYLRRFHNRTQITLVPTRRLAADLSAAGYRNPEVLARGVDTTLFHPDRRSAALRKTWGISEKQLVVLYAGRLAPEKNLPLAVEAFRAIQALRHDARMLFVGDGPLRRKLEQRCPDALFAGMRTGADLAAHYASADLFLFPSLTETFGNVTLEALASGLGVVAYAEAAAADLIVNGVNGCRAAPGDAQAFIANAVALAHPDGNVLHRIRANSASSIAHLDWEAIHDRFAHILSAVAASSARRDATQRLLVVVPD